MSCPSVCLFVRTDISGTPSPWPTRMKLCIRNLHLIWRISIEKKFAKLNKNFTILYFFEVEKFQAKRTNRRRPRISRRRRRGGLKLIQNFSLLRKKTWFFVYIWAKLRCLKITEKVSFKIVSEASYVYILSGQKLIKNAKNGPFRRVFENLKLAVKQCYQTGHF